MVVNYARDRLYMIGTLKEFQHVDMNGFDQGGNVRNKAKDLVWLLSDEAILEQARANKSVPQLRRPSKEPLTIGSGGSRSNANTNTATGNTAVGSRRASYDDLQQLDEDEALARAMRESRELYEKEKKSRSRSLDPSQVYPNFLDNVSRASLAKSGGSQTNLVHQPGVLEEQPRRSSEHKFDQLLDLDDEEFERALDSNYKGKTERSQSEILNLSGIQFGQPSSSSWQPPVQTQTNPFAVNPYEQYTFIQPSDIGGDPFADLTRSNPPSTMDSNNIPMPMAPGMAPVNHMSVTSNNVGAKPVMPHQMAPQFAYTNQMQSGPRGPSEQQDPFAQ